jgi:tetratricopeptide (TPR) repeat protein
LSQHLGIALVLLLAPPRATAAAGDCAAALYDCALAQVNRREFARAVTLLERQLAAAPRDPKALNLLGIALTGARRPQEANVRFEQALALDPAFHPALKNLAVNEFDAGRLAAARARLEQVLKLAPGDEVAHVYLAEIHVRGKRNQEALRHYARAGARIDANPAWLLNYARALLHAARVPAAVAVLERLPRSDATALFEAGVALGEARAHAQAARFFAAARTAGAVAADASYNEILMLIEAGDDAAAIRAAERAFGDGTASSDVYNLAARAFRDAGRIQEAYDALRKAVQLAPDAVENYVDLAAICVEHANLDLGLEIVDVGLRRAPGAWLLLLQRGVLLAMKAQLGEAEKAFEAARRAAPDQPAPYAALAMAWMQSGQTAKAVGVLRDEVRRRPPDHVVPYVFAVALLRSGVDPEAPEAAEAVAALRASTQADPAFAPARSELGKLLLKRDDIAAAIEELEKASALDPASTSTLYNLAQAYRKAGDRAKAAELLARVSKLNDQERGDDPEADVKRVVLRLVREGAAAPQR